MGSLPFALDLTIGVLRLSEIGYGNYRKVLLIHIRQKRTDQAIRY